MARFRGMFLTLACIAGLVAAVASTAAALPGLKKEAAQVSVCGDMRASGLIPDGAAVAILGHPDGLGPMFFCILPGQRVDRMRFLYVQPIGADIPEADEPRAIVVFGP